MRRAMLAVLTGLAAVPAAGGAWLRAPGEAFLSVSGEARISMAPRRPGGAPFRLANSFAALYAEYGVGPDLTLGLDAGAGDSAQAVAFLRRPLIGREGAMRLSWVLGAGARDDGDGRREALLRGGLSWGRGFATGLGNGWANVDAIGEWRLESGAGVAKLDVTFGQSLRDDDKAMLQLQAGDYPDAAPALRVVPSYALSLGGGRHLELGLSAPVTGAGGLRVKLGTWLSF